IEFPVLLDFPVPRLRAYRRETVVAEKLNAMVQHGIGNSRMKDFFDLRFLARTFEFDGDSLAKAIAATFARRGTPLPDDEPLAFTPIFTDDPHKLVQWSAFLKRSNVGEPTLTLSSVVAEIRAFLRPPLEALCAGKSFAGSWSEGGWS
ncbi:MAG: nucleotidyl transferase AbiEii/AbiGii toxin family protein, partial [Polyangiaceae bacterium]